MIFLYLYILSGIFSVVYTIWVESKKADIIVGDIPILIMLFLLNPIFTVAIFFSIVKVYKLKDVVLVKKRG